MKTQDVPFAARLLDWASRGGLRLFPWRAEKDPYRLLVAELMLRRTRATNVVPAYVDFTTRWPHLSGFLRAPSEEVVRVLHPLGLRWRAENFVELQEHLRESDGHELSGTYEELLRLPGVGDYVASAIRCFAGGEARPLIDANSVRVISRVFGFLLGPETRRRAFFRAKAHELVSRTDPRTYNYALLDLAATVCTIQRPRCPACPVVAMCDFARISNLKDQASA